MSEIFVPEVSCIFTEHVHPLYSPETCFKTIPSVRQQGTLVFADIVQH